MGKRLRDGRRAWNLYRALGSLGNDLPEAIELLTGAARPILDRWFESDVLKATLATDAIIGAFAPISAPGSAYVLLHHVMGEAGGGARRVGLRARRHGRAGHGPGRGLPRLGRDRLRASRRCAPFARPAGKWSAWRWTTAAN